MSVQTRGDDRLEDAANCLAEASSALAEIVTSDELESFGEEAQRNILDAFHSVIDLQRNPTLRNYRSRTGRTVDVEGVRDR